MNNDQMNKTKVRSTKKLSHSNRDKLDESSHRYDFFVAGKYDPISKRVIHWDPDLAHLLNLKLRPKANHPRTNK